VGKEAVLEMTQIGKECHAGCQIRNLVGDCIMPREGVFTRVIHAGTVKAGDKITIIKNQDKTK
jgi:MOSC domain-containing protein YiiM